jgi:kynurenine 3-monooxygenase
MSRVARNSPVIVIGAGLCGSLLAILLARRGYRVSLIERRADPRLGPPAAGRSINLAMSARGIRALRHAGLFEAVEPLLLPMRGRLIHEQSGATELLPYGQREDELIWSVSRTELNRRLIDAAGRQARVILHFGQETLAWNAERGVLALRDVTEDRPYELVSEAVIAADGAGSTVRRSLAAAGIVRADETLLPHGYKELTIPAGSGGSFRLEADALHIWPRGEFMLIALPNPGGDFTLTLFLPMEGADGFEGLGDAARVPPFFERWFPDVVPLVPELAETFQRNPVGLLGTVHCRPWCDRGRLLLIGDAAHAIVPFHGQGMNLAFEDCRVLDELLTEHELPQAFAAFEAMQRKNADAIAAMALENYVEMRDTVRDARFVLQKQLAFELEMRLPDRFIPRYSMVMFHDEIPYALAQERGAVQARLLEELTQGRKTLAEIDLDAAVAKVRDFLPPLPSSRQPGSL